VDAAERDPLPSSCDPIATEPVRALERHITTAGPLLDTCEEVRSSVPWASIQSVACIGPTSSVSSGSDQPNWRPGLNRELDLAGLGCRVEAKPIRCKVELAPLDLRRRPGFDLPGRRDLVTALANLKPNPRRRTAVGIAQIAIEELPLDIAGVLSVEGTERCPVRLQGE
jgi:hypothetical protein